MASKSFFRIIHISNIDNVLICFVLVQCTNATFSDKDNPEKYPPQHMIGYDECKNYINKMKHKQSKIEL